MGRKKFGWKDAISLGIQAAGVVSSVTSAQAKVDKAFKDGNATNLEGAQGGASPLKAATSKDIDRSPLIKDTKKNYMQ